MVVETEKIHEASIGVNLRVLYESLGSKMIESDSIVISEQIKNSVDAKAGEIEVDFSKIDEDLIRIFDTGNGMSLDEIKGNWLFLANSNKTGAETLGGKGIGRFSLFRLADTIEIETVYDKKKYSFKLDKSKLEASDIDSFKVDILERDCNDEKGTVIYLRNIAKNIDFLEMQRELENLNTPFTERIFKIKYPPETKMVEFLLPNNVIQDAPFHARITISEEQVIDYSFECFFEGQLLYQNMDMKCAIPNFDGISFGKIEMSIYNFFFDKKNGGKLQYDYNRISKEFLSAYHGVSIYRNNFKIYGHGVEDWLKLAEKRLKRSGENIDNKQTFGYIVLDPESNDVLEEKTSREGFIRTDASNCFKLIIETIIKQFGQDRKNAIQAIKKWNNNQVLPSAENTLNNAGTSADSQQANETANASTVADSQQANKATNASTVTDSQQANRVSVVTKKGKQDSVTPSRNKESRYLGGIDNKIFANIKSDKLKVLLHEISNIDIVTFTNAASFLFRSLVEISVDEYLRKNLSDLQSLGVFSNFLVKTNGELVQNKAKNGNFDKVYPVGPKDKIVPLYECFIKSEKIDKRKRGYANSLADFISDTNLAIHHSDGAIFVKDLRNQWMRAKPFLELLYQEI